MYSSDPKPYNSFGNGAAMRVSACAWAADTMADAIEMSDEVTKVTHNHPEGIKGARAVTAVIFMARMGCSKDEIYEFIDQNYYSLDKSVNKIRETL
jgi:type I restriction enzyme M protein